MNQNGCWVPAQIIAGAEARGLWIDALADTVMYQWHHIIAGQPGVT